MSLLQIENVTVTLRRGKADVPVLEALNLSIGPGELLALVGESGSGKTIGALAVLRLLPDGAKLSGRVLLEGEDLALVPESRMRQVRGKRVGMVFQNPLAALNPSRTVASQIGEAWQVHEGGSRAQARARALELLGEVGIENPATRLDEYPHQFSGGQRQRVMIAMALACSPALLIADEPTTGLDPLIAKQILELIAKLRRERNMGVLFVTHDLSVVEEYADSVHVLYAGRSVEWGSAQAFFAHPRHPYSEALLGAVARLNQTRLHNIPGQLPEPEDRPQGCRFAPRCAYAQTDCRLDYPLTVNTPPTAAACLYPLPEPPPATARTVFDKGGEKIWLPLLEVNHLSVGYGGAPPVLRDVSFTLGKGECLGVVGESGSGKTTLGRAVLQMLGYAGEVRLDGRDFAKLHGAEHRALRRRIQVVFQDPRESMNLRLSIGEIIAEPLRLKGGVSGAVLRSRVAGLLGDVGLSGELAARLPHTVSGGQAQRIAIARALAAEPELLVLDEPTSALDVSTQAMLLNLLKDIAYKRALSTLLISHDFAVVTYMADRIAVLKAGELIELAETTRLISNPQHAYTAALIGAAPQLRG